MKLSELIIANRVDLEEIEKELEKGRGLYSKIKIKRLRKNINERLMTAERANYYTFDKEEE